MMRNASAVAQLEIASRASMSPLVIQEATCDDGVIVFVQGVDAGTYLLLRVQSGSIVVSLSPPGTFVVGAALPTIDHSLWVDWGQHSVQSIDRTVWSRLLLYCSRQCVHDSTLTALIA
jgi:hypothetical protein